VASIDAMICTAACGIISGRQKQLPTFKTPVCRYATVERQETAHSFVIHSSICGEQIWL
jgi:hypothetical protein